MIRRGLKKQQMKKGAKQAEQRMAERAEEEQQRTLAWKNQQYNSDYDQRVSSGRYDEGQFDPSTPISETTTRSNPFKKQSKTIRSPMPFPMQPRSPRSSAPTPPLVKGKYPAKPPPKPPSNRPSTPARLSLQQQAPISRPTKPLPPTPRESPEAFENTGSPEALMEKIDQEDREIEIAQQDTEEEEEERY